MQTISTTTRSWIIDREVQIVVAEEPVEGAARFFVPALVCRDPVRFETSGYHGLSLNRLLIEPGTHAATPIKTVGADRDEMAAGLFSAL